MSKQSNSLINIPDLPPSIDNAIKNVTDKPSLSIGTVYSIYPYKTGANLFLS